MRNNLIEKENIIVKKNSKVVKNSEHYHIINNVEIPLVGKVEVRVPDGYTETDDISVEELQALQNKKLEEQMLDVEKSAIVTVEEVAKLKKTATTESLAKEAATKETITEKKA